MDETKFLFCFVLLFLKKEKARKKKAEEQAHDVRKHGKYQFWAFSPATSLWLLQDLFSFAFFF